MCHERRKPSYPVESNVESDQVGTDDVASDDVRSDGNKEADYVESDASEAVDASKESDDSEEEDGSVERDSSEESDANEEVDAFESEAGLGLEPRRFQQQKTVEGRLIQSNQAGPVVAREAADVKPPKQSEQRTCKEDTLPVLEPLRVASPLQELMKGPTLANSAVPETVEERSIQSNQVGLVVAREAVEVQPPKQSEQQTGEGDTVLALEALRVDSALGELMKGATSANSAVRVLPAQATSSLTTFNLNFRNFLNDFGWLDDAEDIAIHAQNNNQELQNHEEDNGIQARTVKGQNQDGPSQQGTAERRMRLQVSSVDSGTAGRTIGWSESNCGGISPADCVFLS